LCKKKGSLKKRNPGSASLVLALRRTATALPGAVALEVAHAALQYTMRRSALYDVATSLTVH